MSRSSERPGRLPSLRGPRDLTLGGVRKKTFVPNIPVRKERNKQEQKSDETPKKAKRDGRRERQRGRGRGCGRGRPEIIQSHSIFEAGPSAEPVGKRSDAGFGTGGGGGGSSKDAIEKPSIKQELFDEDLEKSKTEEALRNLEGNSSFMADLENDESLMPTSLPMSLSTWPPGKNTKIKNDPENSFSDCANLFFDNGIKKEAKDTTDVLIFQLPDTLPAVPPSNDIDIKMEPGIKIEPGKVKQEPGVATKNIVEDNKCTLEQLSEGYVGKLQVMKSGRCRLILGGIILDLNSGTPSSFQEELVSVRLPPEGQDSAQGHMTVLGNVSHKVICTPDMEHLIMQTKT